MQLCIVDYSQRNTISSSQDLKKEKEKKKKKKTRECFPILSSSQHHLLNYIISPINTTKISTIPLLPNSPQHTQGNSLPNLQNSLDNENFSFPTSKIRVFSMTPKESKHKHAQFSHTKIQDQICKMYRNQTLNWSQAKNSHHRVYLVHHP